MTRRLALLPVVALVAATVVLLAPRADALTTTVVTTTDDGVPGSLRAAFETANTSGDDNEIVLAGGAEYVLDVCGDIPLTNDSGSVFYLGAGTLHLHTDDGTPATIRQTCPDRVVYLDESGDVLMEDVVITGGSTVSGTGIFVDFVSVVLERVTITGNNANESNDGGGVRASGSQLSLIDSTISANHADAVGGGLQLDGGSLTALNSTISGNDAGLAGGGINGFGEHQLDLVTIAGNDAPEGANLNLTTGEISLFGTAFGEPGGGGSDCSFEDGTSQSDGYNFDGDDSCGLDGPGDVSGGGDPQLGALADNGGTTETRLPAAASPLLDGVDTAACTAVATTDQRGVTRPQGPACDIGAVEAEPGETPGPDAEPDSPSLASPATATPATPAFTG